MLPWNSKSAEKVLTWCSCSKSNRLSWLQAYRLNRCQKKKKKEKKNARIGFSWFEYSYYSQHEEIACHTLLRAYLLSRFCCRLYRNPFSSHFPLFAVCDGEDGCRGRHKNGRWLRRDGKGNYDNWDHFLKVCALNLLFLSFYRKRMLPMSLWRNSKWKPRSSCNPILLLEPKWLQSKVNSFCP